MSFQKIFTENIRFAIKALLTLLMSGFLWQKFSIFGKNNTLTQGKSVRAVLEIFQFCCRFF